MKRKFLLPLILVFSMLFGSGFVAYASDSTESPSNYGNIFNAYYPDTCEVVIGDLGFGVNAKDNARGTGFILYSEESVHTRFTDPTPNRNNAENFIAVRFRGGKWQYDNGRVYTSFEPRESDILIAAVNFSRDRVYLLQGVDSEYRGVQLGYASGNIRIRVNRWNNRRNIGEFQVFGDTLFKFCPGGPTPTPSPTATNTSVPPTATNTPEPTATNTPIPPTATNTPVPTATNTPVPGSDRNQYAGAHRNQYAGTSDRNQHAGAHRNQYAGTSDRNQHTGSDRNQHAGTSDRNQHAGAHRNQYASTGTRGLH